MKVWVIDYSDYTPDVCADEKSVRAHLKTLGLNDEEIEKALHGGFHIEEDDFDRYNIGETWIDVKPNYDVIQYGANESLARRGRMLKESDSGCIKPVDFEVYDYNTETGEDETDIEIPEETEDALLGSSYDSVKEMASDIAKKLDDCGFADMTNYEVMEKDDDTEVLITFGLAKGWERNVIVQYETC